ncbi:MAG: hypothetical protein BWY64_01125 [bacterium ADurb.Bin363]|nr:MAG: hypothetical protein BWY64_01125 [bacterium ADurb.Bin363]
MEHNDINEAIINTVIIRYPKQKLATFGVTNIKYFIITEPLINTLLEKTEEDVVVREGKVIAERPQIITPYYLKSLFQGFEHGDEYTDYIREIQGTDISGLLYTYKNDFANMTIVSGTIETVIEKIEYDLDKEGDPLTAIIKGINKYWDISLMKFIFDLTTTSLASNISDLSRRGLLTADKGGLPRDARIKIENLFREVKAGRGSPGELKKELDLWGVFREYENRFLDLFSKK